MTSSPVPSTALPGRSRSSHDRLATRLGYVSIALGLIELTAPRLLARAAGLDGQEGLVRAYGAREIATGIAILGSHDATPWIMARIAGDAADIGTVLAAASDRAAGRAGRLATLAALLGATAVDVFCAAGLISEKGGRRTARADYRDRSGFPKGAEAARGAARRLAVQTRLAARPRESAQPQFGG